MVSDLMTLGGGGGALNTPSSLCELLSLLLLDKTAWGQKDADKRGSYQSNKIYLMACPQGFSTAVYSVKHTGLWEEFSTDVGSSSAKFKTTSKSHLLERD